MISGTGGGVRSEIMVSGTENRVRSEIMVSGPGSRVRSEITESASGGAELDQRLWCPPKVQAALVCSKVLTVWIFTE